MTEKELLALEDDLRPALVGDPSFQPHRDAHAWIARTGLLLVEVKRLRRALSAARGLLRVESAPGQYAQDLHDLLTDALAGGKKP